MVKVSLMSDPSAVITQVNNPSEPANPSNTNNHAVSETTTDFVGSTNINGQKKDKEAGAAGGATRSGGGGGCFRSLFCCLRIGNKRQKPENPPVAPLVSAPVEPAPVNRGHSLLPCKNPLDQHKKCVVIDLDETLVHSSFKPIDNADFVVPIEIDLTVHQVYVLKRPHVDEFLRRMGEMFECVLFTASLAKYADPVADLLDKWEVFRARLFRDSCVYHRGNYVKDLGRLGRELKDVIIIDNSPASYIFHPENAIPVNSWFDDMEDKELLELIPTMEKIANTKDIYPIVKECALSKQKPPLTSVSIIPSQEIGAYTITSPPPPQPPAPSPVGGGSNVAQCSGVSESRSGDDATGSSDSYTVMASTSNASYTAPFPGNARLSGAINTTTNTPTSAMAVESPSVNVDDNSSSVTKPNPNNSDNSATPNYSRDSISKTNTTTTTTTIFSTLAGGNIESSTTRTQTTTKAQGELEPRSSELVAVSNSSQVDLINVDSNAPSQKSGNQLASIAGTTNSTQA